MSKYVATFRAVFDAEDDVSAAVICDQVRLNAEQDLDDDEGDTFECTQVTSVGLELLPDELMVLLRKARNALIKTRSKQCWETAREIDKVLYSMRFRDQPEFAMSGYSYGDFMDLTERIIRHGEEPEL